MCDSHNSNPNKDYLEPKSNEGSKILAEQIPSKRRWRIILVDNQKGQGKRVSMTPSISYLCSDDALMSFARHWGSN